MKNSPGSMIGGIGLTVWVLEWQLSRTRPMISSTFASSTPTQNRGVRLLQEAAGAVQPRRPMLALEQGIDEDFGVLVVNDCDD